MLELPLIPILLMQMQGVCLSAKCQRERRACVRWAAWAALSEFSCFSPCPCAALTPPALCLSDLMEPSLYLFKEPHP